ncbi:energy transducer TonB [Salinisphaera sp. USBA-960]|uniref:energy transducer TonB n=1 Tax=Salinisphaera orenii TaxID=856731 RepID=UPI000DBE7C3F|nr:energy transducer TonB [Salifodinibacter halophilus]NNC25628.1 energy transducer TonB [Salifodinibacter halophilus]
MSEAEKSGKRQSDQKQAQSTVSVKALPSSYRDKLRTKLAKNKKYPRQARRKHVEGHAMVHLVIKRNGHIVDWEFRQKTGHDILDRAVKRMIRSSDPFPAFPSEIDGQRLELTVPVVFRLE